MKKSAAILFVLMFVMDVYAQQDSSHIHNRLQRIEHEMKTDSALRRKYDDMTFYFMQMYPRKKDSVEGFRLSGYIDAYYAWYSDSVGTDQFQKFPTAAPKSESFGLNMLMLSGRYAGDKIRGVFTLHYGDIPDAAWSAKYNMIQEANIGLRVAPKVWVDAGFFRTHLGYESIQPRENIGTGIAITTYYEPYFLSGVKVSYHVTPKLMLQAGVFNGFNTFVETNRNKALGFTVNYEINDNWFVTYNNLLSDESPDGTRKQMRLYHNMYSGYRSKKWDIGLECNIGTQQHSKLSDSAATAYMFSALAGVRYKFKNDKFSVYVRGEVFEDSDEILTGPVENANHQLVGINLWGAMAGVQFKPVPNSYIRLEQRSLITEKKEDIFRYQGRYTNNRYEVICAMGVWF